MSVWADMHRRSNGLSVRQEDVIRPTSNPELKEIIKNEIKRQGNELDLRHIDVSQISNMRFLFYGYENLTSLNLSGWDVSNVSLMQGVFLGCKNLVSINLSGWNVSSVVEMYELFCGCSSLKKLDISDWDVSNVRDMGKMFYGCSQLQSLDLSKWKVNDPSTLDMFTGCGVYYKKWGKRMIKKSSGQ